MAQVILVNKKGEKIGVSDVMEAHIGEGKLHKGFSVYVFRNKRAELLIQRRSPKKMLWPMFWANTCCSHPINKETPCEAGMRRLKEELGFTCELTEGPSFVYRAEDPNGKGVEHEYLTLLIGDVEDIKVVPNPDEVAEYKWANVNQLIDDMKSIPSLYAPWLKLGLPKILET
ncbi:isopentenyl-diphosphate delta-isomerase [Candidatus Kaiserbacteria bacterium RIFCSPHIGHO2_02_FULL_49_16]|uniref:Isopentenyl-diphosphate delta-isomerase n=1 Tax=Candidatus Kaiserbacteria bacterium RIFCSPHIGHO2_02_FULL_49_16 TaxID=1798490 RepID=A0A1F6DBK4_9BACT|nr:MAG: isopentenyl-diphosphate delta-isomerase [Candidatus Kaiserbacteria bacterium RIFCSPHIGHO2_02_FULL_49_16]